MRQGLSGGWGRVFEPPAESGHSGVRGEFHVGRRALYSKIVRFDRTFGLLSWQQGLGGIPLLTPDDADATGLMVIADGEMAMAMSGMMRDAIGVRGLTTTAICVVAVVGGQAANTMAQEGVEWRPGTQLARRGDEICVCGQLFHTGAPVRLWIDPGGYDAYRVERRFAPPDEASWRATQELVPSLRSPNRYGSRRPLLTPALQESVREHGWDLDSLCSVVDQFVLHYDACGYSQQCFRVLHDQRGLSVHFMLDVDGTIYQTLDLKERAWHATTSNSRSIGIEMAQIGAYPDGKDSPLDRWYAETPSDGTRIVLPGASEQLGIARPLQRPDRSEGTGRRRPSKGRGYRSMTFLRNNTILLSS